MPGIAAICHPRCLVHPPTVSARTFGGMSPLTSRPMRSNTTGMKAAISIPDDVFDAGERLARRLKTSRSQLYARALADFVVQHDEDQVTAAQNRVVDAVGANVDGFSRRAAGRALRRVEW